MTSEASSPSLDFLPFIDGMIPFVSNIFTIVSHPSSTFFGDDDFGGGNFFNIYVV
jgi:hypothetical protein